MTEPGFAAGRDELISMVIVNYNAGNLLARCLDAIASQTYPAWEVIIVDNASADDSLDRVRESDRVAVVRNADNRGFAAGQNQGLRRARGRYLMPLNFDIEMTPRFLEEMMAALAASPQIGSVTGKLLQMTPDGVRGERLYSAGHDLPANRFVRHRGANEPDHGQYDVTVDVSGAPGAAPLYRREMLDDIAFRGMFFDESLFTWYEDVDLDWRARRLGWRCVYTPRAVAYHIGHPEGHGGDPWKIRLNIRNRWLVILANDDLKPVNTTALAMLRYEIGLLRYVVTRGFVTAYLRAMGEMVAKAPAALAKRRWTSRRARARGAPRPRSIHRIAGP